MKGPNDKIWEAKEILQKAFLSFQIDRNITSAVDAIIRAAICATKIDIRPFDSRQLRVTLGNENTLEIDIPFKSLSSFRTFLARVAFISFNAGQRLPSKIPYENVPSGFTQTLQEMATENPECLHYISARFPDPSRATVCALEAELIIETAEGLVMMLQIGMQNDADAQFLKIAI